MFYVCYLIKYRQFFMRFFSMLEFNQGATTMSKSSLGANWVGPRKEVFTPEELAAIDLRVTAIREIIETRQGQVLFFQKKRATLIS